jgi:hypothetical protein
MKRAALVLAIAMVHFVTWVSVTASVMGRAIGREAPPTAAETAALAVLALPFEPLLGERLSVVAMNSLAWGLVLGACLPAVWRRLKR